MQCRDIYAHARWRQRIIICARNIYHEETAARRRGALRYRRGAKTAQRVRSRHVIICEYHMAQ